jgi:hypothetical protein
MGRVHPALQPFIHLSPDPSVLSAQEAAENLLLGLVALPWKKDSDLRHLAGRCDWDYFLRLSAKQAVAPLLYAHLLEAQRSDWVPERAMTALAKYHATALARNILLLSETAALCDRFQQHGIPIMLLKGITLLEGVYPHPALRPMIDIDILVHKRDLSAVRRIVVSECRYRRDDHLPAAMDELICRTTFVKPDAPSHLGKLLLEVHWNIFPVERSAEGTGLPSESFWRGAQTMPLGGQRVCVPSPADHLCYIAIHNDVHYFTRLIGLLDIAYLLPPAERQEEWDAIVRCAKRQRCRVSLFLSLGLLAGLLGLTFPYEVIRDLSPSTPRVQVLARIFRREVVLSGNLPPDLKHFTRLAATDSLGDALRFAIWMMFPPWIWLVCGPQTDGPPAVGQETRGYIGLLARRAQRVIARLLRRTANKS